MNANISRLYDNLLQLAASSQTLGINLIRVAILIVFVWIGGLKFQNYEAEGIVPFVANSPFMSFFYTQKAPEYKNYKLKEGEFDAAKHEWHVRNNTYGFSHGLGILIMAIGVLVFLGIFSARIGRRDPCCDYDRRHTLVPRHDTRSVGSRPGQRRSGLPVVVGSRTARGQGHGYPRRGTRRSFGFGPAHPAEKERRRDTKPLTRKERPARYPAPRVTNRRSERV